MTISEARDTQQTTVPSLAVRARDVLACEWTKLRSVRSTFWTLLVAVLTPVAISALVAVTARITAARLYRSSAKIESWVVHKARLIFPDPYRCCSRLARDWKPRE